MAAIQRIRQGVRALLAFSQTPDYTLAAQYLNPQEMVLFKQMGRSEQLHSLNVLRYVLAQSVSTLPDDLATAALLHDCGKSRQKLAVWQKTIAVLVRKFLPKWDESLSAEEKLSFLTAPFVVRRYHPKWGAELLAETDTTEGVIWLVAHHQDNAENWADHPHYETLCRLQDADNAN